MQPATRESICNQAIAKIRAKAIASYTEDSLEARECRRFYPEVVAAMLEGPEDWSFAIQRATLAQLATNDRDGEWTYAYQVPSNMAHAIRVLPTLTNGVGLGLPVEVSSSPYMEVWSTPHDLSGPYLIVGEKLYTNIGQAVLEYRIDAIDGVLVPKLVGQALATELAYFLAVPVKGDSQREQQLFQAKELAWEQAIAENRNRNPNTFPDYESETLAARHGYR